jgi:two-component system, OmpR family, phosphate regulon sensor histidine kinase PhoR
VAALAYAQGSSAIGPVILVAVCAAVAAIAFGYWSRRQEADETVRLFENVLAAHVPVHTPVDAREDSPLEKIASRFAGLLGQAAKDQAQLRTIISSMSDGLIATDHEQRILLTNTAAEELMCFRTPYANGKQLWEIVPIEAILKAVTEVSLTGQQKTISVGPVENRHLNVTVCRLPLRPAGFVIVAHDVTETMRYEELRKEFVANVSHELRTPLTVIKGYVETLRDGALDDGPRAVQYLATVEKHADHLTNLVQDLLSLSRLDSTTTVPNPRPVHLNQVVARVKDLMSPAAEKKGHTFAVNSEGALRAVVGNPEYLERAIGNLVENAIKYTRDGGTITVGVRAEGEAAVVEVSDNGIGISEQDLPRIFERFYRAERSRSRDMGGTGLGLSIVKHIVQAHGGTIDVVSTPGQGSVFRIRLPLFSGKERVEPKETDAASRNP